MDKPFSPSSERNRGPILEVLRTVFGDRRRVLEIGSGTGQHAVWFAAALPALVWQTSERAENLHGLRLWLGEAMLPNTPAPLELDVARPFPAGRWDAVFTANTLHIMGWAEVASLFAALPDVTEPHALLVVYGPFSYGGRHTGPGNAAFDASLRAADPKRGLRDVEAVDALARQAGFEPVSDLPMPADNRCLVWRRAGSTGAA